MAAGSKEAAGRFALDFGDGIGALVAIGEGELHAEDGRHFDVQSADAP